MMTVVVVIGRLGDEDKDEEDESSSSSVASGWAAGQACKQRSWLAGNFVSGSIVPDDVVIVNKEGVVVSCLVVRRDVAVHVVEHDLGDALDPRLSRGLLGAQDVEVASGADLETIRECIVDESFAQRLRDIDCLRLLRLADLRLHQVDSLPSDALLERIDETCRRLEMDDVLCVEQYEVFEHPLWFLLLLALLLRLWVWRHQVNHLH
mmetsp:Transcript_55013/g.109209  ORF Transcript_55013/g.109209 Transcript_55013/m.109209 type:complete len:207 (-) Transcript_55013:509-1129(-)